MYISTRKRWPTGRERYLNPLKAMIRLRLKYLKDPPVGDPEPGSPMWCTARMNFVERVALMHRLLSGNRELTGYLMQEKRGGPYLQYRLTGNRNPLTRRFKTDAEALSRNFPLYTQEVPYTDRVLVKTERWFKHSGIAPGGPFLTDPWDMGTLYSCVTGDPGGVEHFPGRAVRWLTRSRNIAALVRTASYDRFEAKLFHFGSSPRKMGAELFQLTEGSYIFRLSGTDGNTPDEQEFERKEISVNSNRSATVNFSLPPRTSVTMQLERK